MVLVSLTYAAAAVRMSRRGVLAQQLNAIESLASVDTICVDKTGTLTEPTLRVVEVLPAPGVGERARARALARLAASASARNLTLQAIADGLPAEPQPPLGEVPFSSRRRWSAVAVARRQLYLGAPGRVPLGELAAIARRAPARRGGACSRSLAAPDPLPAEAGELPPAAWSRSASSCSPRSCARASGRRSRSCAREGVEIKVLSGDAPQTVAAIARDVGIPVAGVRDGEAIPDGSAELRAVRASRRRVVGRISPEGKQAIVQALADGGPLRRDGRRRRQRRPGAEELAAGDRAGQRHADGAQRRRPRADLAATSRPSRSWSPRAGARCATSSA